MSKTVPKEITQENKKFYITSSIPYASRKPHIGNAYEIILTDAIARYKKMKGYDVCFCTGTDEHGQKIEEIAKKENITPADYAKKVSKIIKNMWLNMNCCFDIFIKTTDNHHVETVQKIFKKLYDKGDIYKGEYEGFYCIPCESFWTDRQLKDNKCPECKREVRKTKESAYFLKVGKYQEKLIEHIEKNEDFIIPKFYVDEIKNNFLKPGLQDFCISRNTFKWGINIDFDPDYVIYVWLDALINYITALGYNTETTNIMFDKFWPADLQVFGKDIVRFHAIIWPIILMMLELPLPKQMLVHPWLLYKQDKMSKSTGNVLYCDDLAKEFSVDTVRFYVLKVMPMDRDGSISYENIISTNNSDLSNIIGNLVKRVCDMIYKYFNGEMPNLECKNQLEKSSILCLEKYITHMENYNIAEAISEILNFARTCNKYIDDSTPWILAKDETKKENLKNILYSLTIGIKLIGFMLFPIIPESSKKILSQIDEDLCNFCDIKNILKLKQNKKIKKPEVIFKRF